MNIGLLYSQTVKYLFYKSSVPANRGEIISNYLTGTFIAGDIETVFAVGTPGIATISISYSTVAYPMTTETIHVDTTSSASFWADILGWLYANNLSDIRYNATEQKWEIVDLGTTYLQIK